MKHKMLKNLKSFVTVYVKLLLFIVISCFFLLNIFFSQLISPLYFQMVKEDKIATVNFLQRIRNLPVFDNYFLTNSNIYGNRLEEEVFENERNRKEAILMFETALQKNPKSRDILYNLYLLYKEDSNNQQAEEYIRLAKEIDPELDGR